MNQHYCEKIIVVSGIGPGPHGVSKLLEHLIETEKYQVICPSITPSLRNDIYHGYFCFFKSVSLFLTAYLRFKLKILGVILFKIEKLIIIHHHSIGLFSTVLLMMRARTVGFFCIDSSFFCIKSYNFRLGAACIRCARGERIPSDCRTFPSKTPKFVHRLFFHYLFLRSERIVFLCQTNSQARLVQMSYPRSTFKIVGLMTSDIKNEISQSLKGFAMRSGVTESLRVCERYLVFHGSSHPAKGFFAILGNPDFQSWRIVFPFAKDEVAARAHAAGHAIPPNWEFWNMSWESGLRIACISAEAVLCPSRWSAPIEGALIKSLCVNHNVIVWGSEFSYSSEVPDSVIWNADKLSPAMILASINEQSEYDIKKRKAVVTDFLRAFQNNFINMSF